MLLASIQNLCLTKSADHTDDQQEAYFRNFFVDYLDEQRLINSHLKHRHQYSLSSQELDQEKELNQLSHSSLIVPNEIFCKLNDDCIDTTYCCSDYSCVHPSKCLHGQKVIEDTCDYNFECYSRCCTNNVCAHFLNCYKTCSSNSECDESGCCSEGYCTHDVVCEGNKVINDSCDEHKECLTRYCDPIADLCASGPLVDEGMGVLGVIGIALSSLILLLAATYCCKAWHSDKPGGYLSAASLQGNGGQSSRDKNSVLKDG